MKATLFPKAALLLAVCAPLAPAQDATAVTAVPISAPLPTSRVPASLAVLVPDDATVFGMSTSLNELEATVQGLVNSVMPGMGAMASLDMAFAELFPPDFDTTAIDRTLPVGFSVGQVTLEGEPQVFVMVPTTKPDAVKGALAREGEGFVFKGSAGYLAVSKGASYPTCTTNSPLIARLPQGVLAVSVDLDPILTAMDPVIAMGMDQARMTIADLEELFADEEAKQITGVLQLYYDMAEGALASMNGVDLSLDVAENLLDLRVTTHFDAGSPMARFAIEGPTGAERFLSLLDDSHVSVLTASDYAKLIPVLEPGLARLLGAYPADMGAALESFMTDSMGFYEALGTAQVFNGGLSDSGVSGHGFFLPSDMALIRAKYQELAQSSALGAMGMRFVDQQQAQLGDVRLDRFTFEFDFETMLAELDENISDEEFEMGIAAIHALYGERLVLTVAEGPELGVFQINGTDAELRAALNRTLGGRGMLPEAARLQDLAANANPFVVERFDIMALMDRGMAAMGPVMGDALPPEFGAALAGQSTPLTLYMGFERTSMTKGIMLDVQKTGQAAMQIFMLNTGAESPR